MIRTSLKFILKSLLFITLMVMVAKIPYQDLVDDYVSNYISFDEAIRITAFIDGQPAPEAFDSVTDYLYFAVNVFISVILYSIFITAVSLFYSEHSIKKSLPNVFILAIITRLVKAFSFILLFWLVFRCSPYDSFINNQKNLSAYTLIAVLAINLFLSLLLYSVIFYFLKHRKKSIEK